MWTFWVLLMICLGMARVYLAQNFLSQVIFSYGLGYCHLCIYMIFDEVVYCHLEKLSNKVSFWFYGLSCVFF